MKVLRLLPFLVLWIAACSGRDDPMIVPPSEIEIVLLRGDGQVAPAGRALPEPLVVAVRQRTTGLPVPNVSVVFSIISGPGGVLDPAVAVTDELGSASAEMTLGSGLGGSRVLAEVEGDSAPGVEFEVFSVLPPVLDTGPGGVVTAGDVITLGGMNFSPIARHNIVLFSGVRGEVLTSSDTTLEVRVPACLPTRSVAIRVWLSGEGSAPLALDVAQGAEHVALAPGEDAVVDDPAALSCLRLDAGEVSEYLVVAQSTGRVGGAVHEFRIRGLSASTALAPNTPSDQASHSRSFTPGGAGVVDVRTAWDARLRRLEAELPSLVRSIPGGGVATHAIPDVGEQRTFQVLNQDQTLSAIVATVRRVSDQAVFFEDVEAEGSLDSGDLKTLADLFDDPIYPTDSTVFGAAPDLDANERVVVLLTPAVNRLTPRGSTGFIGGFFFGLDLRPELVGSNGGEIIYTLVPDPDGVWSDPRTLSVIRDEVPAILAHELQHLIHFNQRILELGAQRTDALWLSEALAQMAEDVTGEVMEERGDPQGAELFQSGNHERARRFMPTPAEVSLIVSAGQGTLEERGAGWLFLRYLRDRFGGNALLTQLTQSLDTGIDNVTGVTGDSWESTFSDWSAALAVEAEVESAGLVTSDALHFLGIDLPAALAAGGGAGYPLLIEDSLSGDVSRDGQVQSAASAYFRVEASEPGGIALTLSARDGGPLDPSAGLRLRIVRIL